MTSILSRPGRLILLLPLLAITALAVAAGSASAFTCVEGRMFTLISHANQKTVAAEVGIPSPTYPYGGNHSGMLRARTAQSSIGPWELFELDCRGDNGRFAIRAYNGRTALWDRYVTADLYNSDHPGMLRATATSVGARETFTFDRTGGTAERQVGTLRNVANLRYVSMEKSYTGRDQYMLRARASAPGAWEQFTINFRPFG